MHRRPTDIVFMFFVAQTMLGCADADPGPACLDPAREAVPSATPTGTQPPRPPGAEGPDAGGGGVVIPPGTTPGNGGMGATGGGDH